MLQIFPFVGWLALITSIMLLGTLFASGDLRLGVLVGLGAWCLIAAYCQFFAASPVASASGLALQTLLAVCLIARWRFTS
jgi:hypothetical protein